MGLAPASSHGGSSPFSGASFTRAASQTGIPVNTPTLVTWTTTSYDIDGYASVPGTDVTIPVTGYYLVSANLSVVDDAGVDGVMYLVVQDGLGATLRQVESFYQGANGEDVLGVSDVMLLVASSVVRVQAIWASVAIGATTFQVRSGAATHFTLTRLGTP